MRQFNANHKTKLSVIIPCFQQVSELSGCLEALKEQTTKKPFEIIVVDSGNDPGVRTVASEFLGVRCITGKDHLYCGAAKHYGAIHAKGDYFAFTDSDCRPEKEWIEQAYKLMESGVKFAGGPILDALPWHLVSVSDNVLQFSDFQSRRPVGPIKHIPGANIIISKAAFFSSGGLPPLNSGDDVRLTINYNKLHKDPIFYSPKLRVRHIGRQTLAQFFSHQHGFGKVRGEMGLFLSKKQIRFGSKLSMLPAVVLKRYAYIISRSMQFDLRRFIRDVLLTPILILGLTAYAVGFQIGCKLNISSRTG
ncbi:MAG: glycosyltransferase family 2 protein [Anaerolineae bacterium]|jgi:glycosyltransferase involved in cell wall biosynthesis|nr:glycosyltransferase family 2 protein [Anaerolineae bacterium]MBT7070899.1 glycosyltransferase family 2 protein [Anaerolineae bacterium]MBT7324325.1 glycosyltransferase family 2 protein [Anaerolineae bacterium]MBT7599792.1 glycosyltransferase family 2 protein [Anaerolineae bacterium]